MAERWPEILHEDNHTLVAVKKPNVLSQSDITGDPDMLSLLKDYIKIKYEKPGAVYLGLVHRLDRPVGGLMVFARTSKAAARLSEQMRTHSMGREYLCVVEGEMPESFTLTDWLLKDEKSQKVRVVPADTPGCQKAVLHGCTLAAFDGTSLIAIRLETGRQHQIRVQMSHAGAPLWGDQRYGHGKPGQQIALWGYRLRFAHPTTHEVMTFHSLPRGGVWSAYADLLNLPYIETVCV